MTLAILGAGGHAKSIYDIIKNKKRIYFYDKKKINHIREESKLANVFIGTKKFFLKIYLP